MRRHVVGLVSMAVGTFGIFLGACSSSNSGTGSASTSSAFADQYCSYMASCCGAENYPSDGKQCHSILAFEGSSSYNEQAGNACIAAVQAASQKDPAWCVDDVAETNKACDPVFGKSSGGSVQPGGTCKSDSDCAAAPAGDTVTCRDYFGSSGGSTRICQVWVPGKAGDSPCIGTQTVTASGVTETSFYDSETSDGGAHPSQGIICYTSDGVTCQQQNGVYTCVALGQVGDSCESTGSNGCVPSAYCDFSSGKCLARVDTGQACTAQDTCVAGDYCDIGGSANCAAQLGSGAACTTSSQCQSDDCTNGKCGAGIGSLGLSLFCGNPVSSGGDAGK